MDVPPNPPKENPPVLAAAPKAGVPAPPNPNVELLAGVYAPKAGVLAPPKLKAELLPAPKAGVGAAPKAGVLKLEPPKSEGVLAC